MGTTYLTKTLGTPTGTKKLTISLWVKRTATGASQILLNSDNDYFYFHSTDYLDFDMTIGRLATNRLFRDTNGWMHIVMAVDTTLGTADDRIKMYINGVQETSFQARSNPSQDATFADYNTAQEHTIGRRQTANDMFLDGVISHYHFIDGTAYAASTFGSTDTSTGQWKINTSPSVTYGNNGFFILKDGNSVTDQSGNSNNWAVGAGTLSNTEDCPSNNFATFNPLSSNNPTLSGGSLIAAASGGYRYALSTIAPSTGKYYAEFKLTTASGYTNFGVENISKGTFFSQYNSNSYIGEYNSGVAYQPGSSSLYHNGSSSGSYGGASSGDVIGIAMDLDNGFIYWHKNGTYLNSGVPTSAGTGTGGYALSNIANSSGTTNAYAMGVSLANTGGSRSISANFGNGTFGTTAISSEGTNASGIGKFEYDVPAGYTALSTKGLNE